jgi:hypothetical protein
MELEEIIKKVVSEVNRTLCQYEKSWVSCERMPGGGRERCESFEHFIELRFNRECYKIPELQKLILATEGHLFRCTSLDDPDLNKNKFSMAHVEMLDLSEIRDEDTDIKEMLIEVQKLFGGRKLSFNSVKKKIKFKIED